MKISSTKHLLVLAALAGGLCAAGEASKFQAGLAKADITPDPAMLNWTVAAPRPYSVVHDPLFVRALVLSDGETKVAMIVWDLTDAREFAVTRVRAAVKTATGIAEDHIMIAATHNHSGPKSEMGATGTTQREQRTSRPSQDGPVYREWADRLVGTCVEIVRKANAALQPATLSIGRAYVGEWLFNRLSQAVTTTFLPKDPYVLSDGLRFGLVDPTLTVLSLRGNDRKEFALLFHVPMHAVAVYSDYPGLSADWPGRVMDRIREKGGAEAMFFQGCAGDIVPGRRGFEAVEAMSDLISARAIAAAKAATPLAVGQLRVASARVGLPATPAAAADLANPTIAAEIDVVNFGPLALVTLPGEPLQEIATAIRDRSPFPHTIVLGYANGRGVGYVGLPGNKAKGGYEMSEVGTGTDEAGGFLVETAVRLLRDEFAAQALRSTSAKK